MKADYITNSHSSLVHFSLQIGWENVLFELGSGRVEMYPMTDVYFLHCTPTSPTSHFFQEQIACRVQITWCLRVLTKCCLFQLTLHERGHTLEAAMYDHACRALEDDYEEVRLAAIKLVWVFSHISPERWVQKKTCFMIEYSITLVVLQQKQATTQYMHWTHYWTTLEILKLYRAWHWGKNSRTSSLQMMFG